MKPDDNTPRDRLTSTSERAPVLPDAQTPVQRRRNVLHIRHPHLLHTLKLHNTHSTARSTDAIGYHKKAYTQTPDARQHGVPRSGLDNIALCDHRCRRYVTATRPTHTTTAHASKLYEAPHRGFTAKDAHATLSSHSRQSCHAAQR
jgi:hypothetical protein